VHALAELNRFVHEMHQARRPDYFKPTRLHDRPENPFRQARRWCEIDQIAVFRRFGFEPRIVVFERRAR
jgi:hypothetical protein